ncbi:class I SAM-dependent methyltransferase [Sphingomonas sp. GM_Shp_1]|uniref:class I SAM-dependent DNA methyltransferase n=1 Tax=Sphingomonas sp. GM_Shp_1 TaxID=2937381 RepID=UPI00226B36D8
MSDPSLGWEGVAERFAALRSGIGVDVVLRWAGHVRPGGAIVDIGCGTGFPIGRALSDAGFRMFGIDPSPTLLAAYRRNVPGALAAEEGVEVSRFFDRRFDGAVMVGLLFLLTEERQRQVLTRIADILHPGGQLLFSAPEQPCQWTDSLTGRVSRSLGLSEYRRILTEIGCPLVERYSDEGGNHYCHARRSDYRA